MKVVAAVISRCVLSTLLLVAALTTTTTRVNADKDSDYYPVGMRNPNLKKAMYWKDSINVLQDLDQFESLYIKYHGCVWTKYGSRYGNGQNYDEQGAQQQQNYDDDQADNQEDGNNNNPCGGWGGEYFWYMGRTQCFKANVAYSLYGILKKGSKGSSDDPCSEKTYINSFFTTFGVESFSGPLGLDTDDANSYCQAEAGQDGDDDGDYSYYQSDDDYLQWDDNFSFTNWEAYTSYGTGCSAQGTFVKDQYSGAFCHGRNYEATLDTLDSFNQAVESLECTRIYNSNDNGSGDNENNYQGKDYNDDDATDFEFEEMDAVEILSFSKSCSLRQYPHDCPDPYGIKAQYARATESVTGVKAKAAKAMNITSYVCLAFGCLLWLCAYRVARNEHREQRAAKQQRRSSIMEIGMKKSNSSDSNSTHKSKESENDADDEEDIVNGGNVAKEGKKTKSRRVLPGWLSINKSKSKELENAADDEGQSDLNDIYNGGDAVEEGNKTKSRSVLPGWLSTNKSKESENAADNECSKDDNDIDNCGPVEEGNKTKEFENVADEGNNDDGHIDNGGGAVEEGKKTKNHRSMSGWFTAPTIDHPKDEVETNEVKKNKDEEKESKPAKDGSGGESLKAAYGFEYVRTASMDRKPTKKKKHTHKPSKSVPPRFVEERKPHALTSSQKKQKSKMSLAITEFFYNKETPKKSNEQPLV